MRKTYARVWVARVYTCDDLMILCGDSKKAQNDGNDHRLCSNSDHLYSNSHHLCSSVSQSSNDGSSGHQYNSSEYSGHYSGQCHGRLMKFIFKS